MGSSDSEPAKLLLPYLQRADELQKHEPLVAYYCRLYAMERGLKIPQKKRTKTTSALLLSLMNQLEKDKKSVTLGSEDHLYLEGFALNVFSKADKQDRAGRADLNTAKTFYAASIFFEIINQFGDLQPDIEQKQKYAVWKAADIRKALKEGRRPEPGPPGGDDDGSVSSGLSSIIDDSRHVDSLSSNQPGKDTSIHVDSFSQRPPVSHSSSFTDHTSGHLLSHNLHRNFSQHSSAKLDGHSLYPQPYHGTPLQEHDELSSVHRQHTSHDMNSYSLRGYDDINTAAASGSFPAKHRGANAGCIGGSYVPQPEPSVQGSVPPRGQYNAEKLPVSSKSFVYDCNYQPPPDKIGEAHKAARFAVGALAFDDVPVAVDFLRRSIELLTNPSAEIH